MRYSSAERISIFLCCFTAVILVSGIDKGIRWAAGALYWKSDDCAGLTVYWFIGHPYHFQVLQETIDKDLLSFLSRAFLVARFRHAHHLSQCFLKIWAKHH